MIEPRLIEELRARYSEPHRSYHNLAHVEHCLREFARVRHFAADPEAVEAAIWFHDAIYDPKAKDNEEQSAHLALAMLPGETGLRVARLIEATKHDGVAADPDAALLCDIDLSILAADEHAFEEYERQVRREYAWVPDEAFARGRSAVLRSFLARQAIYQTEPFRNLEAPARANLERALAKWTAG